MTAFNAIWTAVLGACAVQSLYDLFLSMSSYTRREDLSFVTDPSNAVDSHCLLHQGGVEVNFCGKNLTNNSLPMPISCVSTSPNMMDCSWCSPQYGWAEGGLVMAENIMRRYFGATTPSWMNETTAAASTFGATYSDSESVAQVSHLYWLENGQTSN